MLNSLYKLFSSCLLYRITPQIVNQQPIEQAGFRSGFSTNDYIHTIEQILEKYCEYQKPLYLAFIDYKKAFDTIFYDSIWEALDQNNINSVYINIIKDAYVKSVSKVKLETLGSLFPVKREAKQVNGFLFIPMPNLWRSNLGPRQ
ncbi:jg21858 [Pararge aegeria aegeria]|uniref:Jg21858 protein n=1 Tax=Pararge aegeria aegeria TaxID=348720 RepID=A0A8S4QUA4_9NEOP|nr:jg21858 [Pararge aegeria aegeria]